MEPVGDIPANVLKALKARIESDRRESAVGFEIQSESGRDVRRDLAKTIVTNGWGLLELRPMRMSLEEIFLHVTTEEEPETAAAEEVVQ